MKEATLHSKSSAKIAFMHSKVLLHKMLQTCFISVDGFQISFSRNRNKFYFISHIYFASPLELNQMLMLGKKRSIIVQKDGIQSPHLLCLATF